jgi:hypothetical protein
MVSLIRVFAATGFSFSALSITGKQAATSSLSHWQDPLDFEQQ